MKNFTGYVDLSNNENFQEIYSSQLYGNFFGIFSSFQINSNKDNCYELNRMELQLFNYKGVVNMGISNAEIFKVEEGKFIIKLEVQALNEQDSCGFNCNNISIPKGSKILIDRRLKKMHADCKALRNGLFDNEFYYREGGDVYPERQPKPLEWGEQLPDEILEKFKNEELILKGDIQCPRRLINVL